MTTRLAGGLLWGYNPKGERAASQGAALRYRSGLDRLCHLRGRRMRLFGKGVLVLLDAQLVQRLVMGLLLSDVFGYRGLVEPDGGYVVALAPKLPVAELVFQVAVLLEYHERAFPLEISHEARHAHLGRDADQHVHVVGHQVPF